MAKCYDMRAVQERVEAAERLRERRAGEEAAAPSKNKPPATQPEGEPVLSAAQIEEQQRETQICTWESAVTRYVEQHGGIVPLELGGMYREDHRHVRLDDPEPHRPRPPLDTEMLLNALIAECHFLMHEVAFHSMRLTPDAEDRLRFMNTAAHLALTGAKVGNSVARLRGVGTEEHHQRLTVEHVQKVTGRPPEEER